MPTDEDIVGDRLHLLPCRPTLMAGVPVEAFVALWLIWGCGLVLFGAAVTGTGVCVMAYVTLRALIAIDFNVISATICYLTHKFLLQVGQKWLVWSGVTLDPLFGQRKPK